MRKSAAALLAVATMLPIGWIAASPADAAAGTSCKTTSGTAKFSPALPKLNNPAKVLSTVTVKGAKIGGCVGGGVTSGTAALSAKFSKPGNCTTLATAGSTNPTKGKETITWNNGKTSTITLTLVGIKGQPKQAKITGTVTAGLFKGMKESGSVMYTPPKSACAVTALSVTTFKQLSATVFK